MSPARVGTGVLALSLLVAATLLSTGTGVAAQGGTVERDAIGKADNAGPFVVRLLGVLSALAGAIAALGLVGGRTLRFAERSLTGASPDYRVDRRRFARRLGVSLAAVWWGVAMYTVGPLLYWTAGVTAVAGVGYLAYRRGRPLL